MYLVAKDGSGDFASIQAAVDAVPAGQAAHIHILPGVYEERVILNKSRVRLTGEDRKNTVITHSACAKDRYPDGKEKGTFLSFSVLVTGDDVTVEQSWHPGYVDYFVYRLGERANRPRARQFTVARCQDVAALCDPRLFDWIKEHRIELCNFRDALYGTREYQTHLRETGSPLYMGER